MDPAAAEQAREHCERVIVGDLDSIELGRVFEDERFDVAVFGDVLEHLKDPAAMLRQVQDVLAPGGFVVASIPNVAHGAIRLALLRGDFEYRELGLLDATHLHMFTKDSVEALFRDAGFAISEMQPVGVGIFGTEVPLRRRTSTHADRATRERSAAVTYQFVVKAVVGDASGVVEELRRRVEAHHAEAEGLRARYDQEKARADEVTRWAEHLFEQLQTAEHERDEARRAARWPERLQPSRIYGALRRRIPPADR